MSDGTPVRHLTCGTCRYYVERPAELLGVCYRDGVCLKCAKAVDGNYGARDAPSVPGCHVTVLDGERGVVRPGCWREARDE
ncbi:hypothetical protein AAK967_00070 [Atopobiaceae bacterium 24-176]